MLSISPDILKQFDTQTIIPELTAQLEAIKKLHNENIPIGYVDVFLEGISEL